MKGQAAIFCACICLIIVSLASLFISTQRHEADEQQMLRDEICLRRVNTCDTMAINNIGMSSEDNNNLSTEEFHHRYDAFFMRCIDTPDRCSR